MCSEFSVNVLCFFSIDVCVRVICMFGCHCLNLNIVCMSKRGREVDVYSFKLMSFKIDGTLMPTLLTQIFP